MWFGHVKFQVLVLYICTRTQMCKSMTTLHSIMNTTFRNLVWVVGSKSLERGRPSKSAPTVIGLLFGVPRS